MSGEGWRIREAGERDAAAMERLFRIAAGAASWSEESIRQTLGESGARAVVAEKDGEVGGAAIGSMVADEAEVLNVAVEQGKDGLEWARRYLTN